MEPLPSVAEILDDAIVDFTSVVKARLADLSAFTTDKAIWPMVEHFQFSKPTAHASVASRRYGHVENGQNI